MSHTLFSPERLVVFDEIDSTNTWAKGALRPKVDSGTVIWAKNQTQGRGQKGTTWISEKGQNLTFSLVFTPNALPATHAFYLSKISSIALCHTLGLLHPNVNCTIKWPNDIWIGLKKIAGILIENQVEGSRVSHTIIGIGLNVNQDRFGPGLREKATSLSRLTGKKWELEPLLWAIVQEVETWIALLHAHRWSEIDSAYFEALWGYKKRGYFERDGIPFEAFVEGVEENGRLLLRERGQLKSWDIKELVWKGIAQ